MAILTSYWSLDCMIFTIAVIIATYMYATRKFRYWKNRGVVEVPPIPFAGNFADCLLMKRSPGELTKELYDRFANLPYMGFYILDRPFFLVRDPELIKNILVRDFNYFMDRFASTHGSISAPKLFFQNNPGWKTLKVKLTPTFTSAKLKKMFELMLEVSGNLKTYLHSLELKDDHVLEVKDFASNYATDIIGATAFGINVDSLNNPDSEFRKSGREIFRFTLWRSIQMTSLFFVPQLVKLMGIQFISDKISNFQRQLFWDVIAARERSGIKRNDLIDRLMDLKKNEVDGPNKNSFEFDGDNLVAQASSFLVGGYETVSTAISFTLYELALAPIIQSKLRREIKDAIENNNYEITYDLVTSLSYLDMVISETLRKHPSLPFLDRVATSDYKVPNSNLVLEKGTPVHISMLGLHYDPQYFPDPQVFDPERFTEENKRNRKSCVYLPFGDGPRTCIATRFALLETKLAIVQILSDYELSPCEKTLIPMRSDPKALLLIPDGGLYLKIRKVITVDN